MDNSKELKDREKIVKNKKQIAKSNSIHKKYHALKTGKIKEALEKHFKCSIFKTDCQNC